VPKKRKFKARRLPAVLAAAAVFAPAGSQAQQSLPSIEVGAAPLRSAARRAAPPSPGPVIAHPAAAAGRVAGSARRAAQAPVSTPATAPAPQPAVSPLLTYQVPAAVHIVSSKEIANSRQFDVGAALQRAAPGVAINDVGGNPFMPEVDYRGFAASPIGGTPQGLAVYQNGVRINEAWGDMVNWDLIPSIAIDRLAVVTGNPLFGLNAIGGAITLDMKNGFSYQGFEIDARHGSRGRRQGAMQYGVQAGPFAGYVAMEALGDNGYRKFSGTHIKRFYGDVGYQGDRAEIHANVTLAQNRFGVSGPAPVDLISIDKGAVYTTPQTIKNTLAMYDINGQVQASETWKLFGDFHYRAFDQARVDGNTTEFECEEGEEVCESEAGNETQIPNIFNGGVQMGAIDRSWTRSRTVGGTVQANNTDRIFGFPNKFTFGVSLDHGWTAFGASEEFGVIQSDLTVAGIGHFVEEPGSAIASVSLRASNNYLGVYALDSLELTDKLTVTAGARFNRAGIALYDLKGVDLNGNAVFTRINPMAGVTYKILPDLVAYASFSEANRAPTPLELGCADPNRPCIIDNFLVADPPLKQVQSQTIETGLRGSATPAALAPQMLGLLPGMLEWSAGLFRTHNFDDILSVPSSINGRGYFTNAGTTLRQGVETSFRYHDERLSAYVNYTLTDATFRSQLMLGAPDNPLAQAIGSQSILINPGAHLSSIPRHRLKGGLDYALTPQWKVGGDVVYSSGPWLRGDEINFFGTLSPYAMVNLRSSFQFTPNVQVYGLIENVTNTRGRSFGTFFDTNDIRFLAFGNPRMVSLTPPIGVYGGVKVNF
jgi:iron complex outermembrane receptor protein